jgi:hypothetical protein
MPGFHFVCLRRPQQNGSLCQPHRAAAQPLHTLSKSDGTIGERFEEVRSRLNSQTGGNAEVIMEVVYFTTDEDEAAKEVLKRKLAAADSGFDLMNRI